MPSFDAPLDVDRAAVVVVDMQNDYVHEEGGLPLALGYETEALQAGAERMADFLDGWRARGGWVVHVRTHQSPATNSTVWDDRYQDRDVSICVPDTWGAAFYEGLEPAEGEPVVTKHRYSGYADTDLGLVLRSNDVETLVMAGCLTHVCVEATARDAFHADHYLVFPEDCCATTDDFADLHEATLRNMGRFYGDVTTSEELLAHLDERASATGGAATGVAVDE